MYQQPMHGMPASSQFTQPAHLGPGLTRMPWIFTVAGGAASVLAFTILFLISLVSTLAKKSFFLINPLENLWLTMPCCLIAIAGAVVAGIGYTQLKTYYGSKGNLVASDPLKKLALYNFIIAGLFFIIAMFVFLLNNQCKYGYYALYYSGMTTELYAFFIASAALVFGLIHHLLKLRWIDLTNVMGWDYQFTKLLRIGYTLAFWAITVSAAILAIASLLFIFDALSTSVVTFVGITCMLGFFAAATGGVLWVLAQFKLMLRFGDVLPAAQPSMQQPMQQGMNQTFMLNQTPQPMQQYQPQPIQPQQPNQTPDYNDRLRQQQYEEYRRQQQQRMREMGDDSPETVPYKK